MRFKGVIISIGLVLAAISMPLVGVYAQQHDEATHNQSGSAGGENTPKFGCKPGETLCIANQYSVASERLITMTPPQYEVQKTKQEVTYSVATRGTLTADINEFKRLANETLNDTRGWTRMGVTFKEVATGGQFTLNLSSASEMTSFSANGCDNTYSCVVGRNVVINQDRWLGATPAWNQGGGTLRDYRHMVINHETGHWLGLGHANCSVPGQPAPVMQQQSMSLQGCTFNPWPLDTELKAPTLGL